MSKKFTDFSEYLESQLKNDIIVQKVSYDPTVYNGESFIYSEYTKLFYTTIRFNNYDDVEDLYNLLNVIIELDNFTILQCIHCYNGLGVRFIICNSCCNEIIVGGDIFTTNCECCADNMNDGGICVKKIGDNIYICDSIFMLMNNQMLDLLSNYNITIITDKFNRENLEFIKSCNIINMNQ